TKIQLAAMSRVDTPEAQRRDFYLYIDEFQNFATASFANILSEARKYRLSLILAHQYIRQLVSDSNTIVKDAIFGNVGTMVTFRVGAEDAEHLEKEFQPDFMANDLVSIPKYNFYTKLMIDGIPSRPFSASTIPPFDLAEYNLDQEIIKYSREKYGTSISEVSAKIAEGFKPEEGAEEAPKKSFKKKSDFEGKKFTPRYEKSEKPPERKIFSKSNPLSVVLKPKPEKERGPIIKKFVPAERPEKKKVNIGDLRAALAKSLERAEDEKL
ncbi:TraM recognition domain-containing protein, partial [Candidatus Wolfebacteria bacterium]|nr:TraM recognition domain-containing protein [Candidatus Wolfebacteria bacterium]